MIKALGPAFGNDSEDGQDDEDKFMRAAPPPARTIPTVSVFVPHILFVPHRAPRSRTNTSIQSLFASPTVCILF